MSQLTPEEIAAEAAQRPRAATYAFIAGALSLLGGITALLFSQALPTTPSRVIDVLEAMDARLVDDTAPPTSLNALQVQYLGDHLVGWVGPTLLLGIGTLLMLFPLSLVWKATRARKEDLRSLGWIMLLIGVIASSIGPFAYAAIVGIDARDFDGTSAAAARDVLTTAPATLAQVVGLFGKFALALGLIILSLNAMRVGLFTRFVGVLGIIVGAAVIIPVPIDQVNLLRSSWLVFVGLILLGKMPGVSSDPPAWGRGEAIPWPTQQEIRERRQAEQDVLGSGTGEEPEPTERGRSRKRRK
ncbi:MAG: hypothetical protein JHC95_03710 [Solirubrobacteraceae bacterium]|nr:hypothetical protein [Solirubrobacteraceae bacterium]